MRRGRRRRRSGSLAHTTTLGMRCGSIGTEDSSGDCGEMEEESVREMRDEGGGMMVGYERRLSSERASGKLGRD